MKNLITSLGINYIEFNNNGTIKIIKGKTTPKKIKEGNQKNEKL